MAGFFAPSDIQRDLIESVDIFPGGMSVIHENEDVLMLKHHKSGNEIMIIKGEAQRRKEKHGNQ